jgi:hypothetical protein
MAKGLLEIRKLSRGREMAEFHQFRVVSECPLQNEEDDHILFSFNLKQNDLDNHYRYFYYSSYFLSKELSVRNGMKSSPLPHTRFLLQL